jgi:hypothetical protein
MALLMIRPFEIDNGARVLFFMARGAFFNGSQMVAVDAFRIVFLNMGFMLEPDLRQSMAGLIKQYDIFGAQVLGLCADVAFLAAYGSVLLFMAIFTEVM